MSNVSHESTSCIAEIAKSAEGLNKLTDNLGVIIKKFILEN